jgi:hypothetical protein
VTSPTTSLSQNKSSGLHPEFFPQAFLQQFVSRSIENKYQKAPSI